MSLFRKKKTQPKQEALPVTPEPQAPVPTDEDANIHEAVRMEQLKEKRKQGRSKTLLSSNASRPKTTRTTLLGSSY